MPPARKRKAPKWLDPPTLDEMETVEETDPMFLNVQIDMLNELISFEEFMQDCLEELASAETEIKEKCNNNKDELFLMPKSPAPKRRGRRKKNADESMNSTTTTTSSTRSTRTSTRSGRAASKVASAKISQSIDDFNLSKKKRRPTQNGGSGEILDMDENSQEPPILKITEAIDCSTRTSFETDKTSSKGKRVTRASRIASLSDISGVEVLEKTKSTSSLLSDQEKEMDVDTAKEVLETGDDLNNKSDSEKTIVTESITNAVMEVDVDSTGADSADAHVADSADADVADVEDNDAAESKDQRKRKSVRRTKTATSRSSLTKNLPSTSSEDEVTVTKKAKLSRGSMIAPLVVSSPAPVPSVRSSTTVRQSPLPAPRNKKTSLIADKTTEVVNVSMEEEEVAAAPHNSTFNSENQQAPRFSTEEPIQKTRKSKSTGSKKSRSQGQQQPQQAPEAVTEQVIDEDKNTTEDEEAEDELFVSMDSGENEEIAVVASTDSNSETEKQSELPEEQPEKQPLETSTRSTRNKQKAADDSIKTSDDIQSSDLDKSANKSATKADKSSRKSATKANKSARKSETISSDTSVNSMKSKPDSASETDAENKSAADESEELSAKEVSSSEAENKNVSSSAEDSRPKRATRTKLRHDSKKEVVVADSSKDASTVLQSDLDTTQTKRSTRTKVKQVEAKQLELEAAAPAPAATLEAAEPVESAVEEPPKRSTRTRQRAPETEKVQEQSLAAEELPKRSTRTKQRLPETTQDTELPKRSTRTKTKQLIGDSEGGSGSDREITKSTASPRVKELAKKTYASPTKTLHQKTVGYTGSPIADRVQLFEKAMKESVGLKDAKDKKDPLRRSSRGVAMKPKRRSSLAKSLMKVSAAKGVNPIEVLQEQDVKERTPDKRPKLIRVGSESNMNKTASRVGPASRVGRAKVLASGGRGVSPACFGSNSGSSSSSMHGKMRSRIDIAKKAAGGGSGVPSNMTLKPGLSGMAFWQNPKPKQPTLEEIQEAKEEEMKKKQEKESEALKRKDEMLKKKAEEQREKRDERMRRVQEARKQQELKNQAKNTTKAKEAEEKMQALKKRDEKLREEAELKKKKDAEKMREAEDRRRKEEEERIQRAEEEVHQREVEEERRRKKDEEIRRNKKMEEKKKLEDAKRREIERIEREREELKRIKETERQKKEQEEMNQTYEVPVQESTRINATQTMNSTQTMNTTQTMNSTQPMNATINKTMNSTQNVDSYNMTPARHELPPAPSKSNDDYGLDDLKSDEETDDEEHPRKQIPSWALGAPFRSALLRQHYMPPDITMVFDNDVISPDLSKMFKKLKSRFYKRTSSMHWSSPPRVHF